MSTPKGKVEIKDPDTIVDTKLQDDLLNLKTIFDATLDTVTSPSNAVSNLLLITKEILGTIGPAGWLEALQNLDTEDQQSLIKKINAHVIKNNVFNCKKAVK